MMQSIEKMTLDNIPAGLVAKRIPKEMFCFRSRICGSGLSCAGWALAMPAMSMRWTASALTCTRVKRSPWLAKAAAENPA